MRTLVSILATATFLILCDGCASHTKCVLYTGKDGSQLEIHQTTRGLIPGVCGFTTHADDGCTFYLPGTKETYQGAELIAKGINCNPSARYSGSVNLLRAKEQVEINLARDGQPFEFNGKYHYHAERNDAVSP